MRSLDRRWAIAAAVAMLALLLPLVPARAGHGTACLDVSNENGQEAQTNPTGTSHTVTATLKAPSEPPAAPACNGAEVNASAPTVINFEITGINDPDGGNTPDTPDLTCTIPLGASACVPEEGYEGSETGNDEIRGWIADGARDDNEPVDETSPTELLDEPDETDVVAKTWTATIPRALDCDDQTGNDRETNPNNLGNDSRESYVCIVTDGFNNPVAGVEVFGENENGANDPDNGATHSTPDYSEGATNGLGRVTITVGQEAPPETGLAEICFWAGAEADGAALCASEPTDETENNDLADQVELTWTTGADARRLDCTPENESNPAGTTHTITCTVTNNAGQLIANANVVAEVTGANDPDDGNSRQTPDYRCNSDADGQCAFVQGGTEESPSDEPGSTIFTVWVDVDGLDSTSEADAGEGQNETSQPGAAEPDGTDVVAKTWTAEVATLVISPDADSGVVGECNPFTITARNSAGQPTLSAVLDVEQIHETATDLINGNEPTVGFCTPASGPNPSGVDSNQSDLRPPQENPDNKGTAGGRILQSTDANGQITVGVNVVEGQGSDGEGDVTLTVFADTNSNDDPDTTEVKDQAVKSWITAGPGGRVIDCEPAEAEVSAGDEHTVTCTVTDAGNDPAAGISVTFSEQGPGELSSDVQTQTDAQGQATVTATSDTAGQQQITGTITNSTQNEPDTDECDRAAEDPEGAPAGDCSDTVTVDWQDAPQPACSDGIDNDGDGEVDFPNDPGCESEQDDDETDPEELCPGYEDLEGNHIVGTPGDDTITGTAGRDIICGLRGDDRIDGGSGNDVIIGGAGADRLVGGAGKDFMRGGSGKDRLRGQADNDRLFGNRGKDTINGGTGKDFCKGGPGKDKVRKCEQGDKKKK